MAFLGVTFHLLFLRRGKLKTNGRICKKNDFSNRDYYRAITTKELNTYFKEVEGFLSWRPLTAISSKMNDFEYLSPMSLLSSALIPSVLSGQILKS